jgi:hypothetical protein
MGWILNIQRSRSLRNGKQGNNTQYLTITIAATRPANPTPNTRRNTTSTKSKPIKWTITKHDTKYTKQTKQSEPNPNEHTAIWNDKSKNNTSNSYELSYYDYTSDRMRRRNCCSRFIDVGQIEEEPKESLT